MIPTIQLSNGVDMPVMGFGTYPMTGDVLYRSLLCALECGCTLFDTAHSYPNEGSIGEELARIFASSSFKREDVFLTSKIGDRLDHGMPMGYYFYDSASCPDKNTRAVVYGQVEDSLRKLRTDYIDLLLIHWPYNDCLEAIWLAMEELYRQGKVRAIGVSNHKVRHLQRIEKVCSIEPMVNQMFVSPINTQAKVMEYCRAKGIAVESYSPLMFLRQPNAMSASGEFAELCAKYGRSAAQIVLRWSVQKHIIPIPKSANPERIRKNYEVFDFALTDQEMSLLDSFNEDWQYLPESVYCPGY